mgnify:FL=1|jgi:hypothetical protein
MKINEWILVILLSGLIILAVNLVGFQTSIIDSIPGVLILSAIALGGKLISMILPFKLPMITYVSLLAILVASPISPISQLVLTHVGKIGFTAPSAVSVAYIGISLGTRWKPFIRQGPKYILVAILVFAGTFVGSALVAQIVLKLTGVI